MLYMEYYKFKMFFKLQYIIQYKGNIFVTHMEIMLTGLFPSIAFVFFACFR